MNDTPEERLRRLLDLKRTEEAARHRLSASYCTPELFPHRLSGWHATLHNLHNQRTQSFHKGPRGSVIPWRRG